MTTESPHSETLPPRDACFRAMAAKDHRFDGLFFIAVRSTGIYCRPVCPAPPPKRQNISFYPNAAAATTAGYRPCLRCRPELSPETFAQVREDAVRRALAMITEGALQDDSCGTLATRVGLSVRQLQRVFLAHVGATPHTVHATRRLLLAKQLLTETALPVTDVALAAGYNSLRRFNAAFKDGCGMPPGAIPPAEVGDARAQRHADAASGLSPAAGFPAAAGVPGQARDPGHRTRERGQLRTRRRHRGRPGVDPGER